jgi:hypothetical protein
MQMPRMAHRDVETVKRIMLELTEIVFFFSGFLGFQVLSQYELHSGYWLFYQYDFPIKTSIYKGFSMAM